MEVLDVSYRSMCIFHPESVVMLRLQYPDFVTRELLFGGIFLTGSFSLIFLIVHCLLSQHIRSLIDTTPCRF